MKHSARELAQRFLRTEWDHLTKAEKRVIEGLVRRELISRDLGRESQDQRTLGERAADRIAAFGGSWPFIGSFGLVLAAWVVLNSVVLGAGRAFDPFPYILLNLFLSMLASLQAPIIMMSQNRQSAKDREQATHDYEVNLKAELEIRDLHDKFDELRSDRWRDLVEMQQRQIELLERLLVERPPAVV